MANFDPNENTDLSAIGQTGNPQDYMNLSKALFGDPNAPGSPQSPMANAPTPQAPSAPPVPPPTDAPAMPDASSFIKNYPSLAAMQTPATSVASPSGPSNAEQEYAKALAHARDVENTNNLIKASSGISKSAAMLTGANPSLEDSNNALDSFTKAAQGKAGDILAKQKFGLEEAKGNVEKGKAAKELQDQDPNSDSSKAFRKAVAGAAPWIVSAMGDSWDKVTSADKDKIYDPIKLKETIDARHEDVIQKGLDRKQALGLATAEKADKRATPSDKQVDTLNKYNAAITQLNSIAATKPTQGTGRASNIQNTVAQFVNMDDAQKSAFKAQVSQDLVQNIKDIAGTRPNPKEMQLILQGLPNFNDNDATFMAKLQKTRDNLVQKRDATIAGFKAQGKSQDKMDIVTPFADQSTGAGPVAPNEETRITKDGKKAIFDSTTKKFIRWAE